MANKKNGVFKDEKDLRNKIARFCCDPKTHSLLASKAKLKGTTVSAMLRAYILGLTVDNVSKFAESHQINICGSDRPSKTSNKIAKTVSVFFTQPEYSVIVEIANYFETNINDIAYTVAYAYARDMNDDIVADSISNGTVMLDSSLEDTLLQMAKNHLKKFSAKTRRVMETTYTDTQLINWFLRLVVKGEVVIRHNKRPVIPKFTGEMITHTVFLSNKDLDNKIKDRISADYIISKLFS